MGQIGEGDLSGLINTVAQMGFNEWLSLVSAGVALVSLMFNRATVLRQNKMQYEALVGQRDSRLVDWANQAIAAIADAQRYCREVAAGLLGDHDRQRVASELRTRMSALLDQGRLFFPNAVNLSIGSDTGDKEGAYSGTNNEVIQALIRVYVIVTELPAYCQATIGTPYKTIVAERMCFVSEVFSVVDPKRRYAALDALAVE